jgi:hypothetical protein
MLRLQGRAYRGKRIQPRPHVVQGGTQITKRVIVIDDPSEEMRRVARGETGDFVAAHFGECQRKNIFVIIDVASTGVRFRPRSCRPPTTRGGTRGEVPCLRRLQHALGAQLLHFLSAHLEAAEDLNMCWPSLGATLRTRTPSPILTGVRMCGISPNSGSLAYCTRPRWRPLRVGEHLRIIIDRAARHAGRFEHFDPMVGRVGHQYRVHNVFQRVAVRHARLIGRKTRVLAPLRMPQSLGTARPDPPRRRHPPSDSRPWSACAGRARSGDGASLAGSAPRGRRATAPRSTS